MPLGRSTIRLCTENFTTFFIFGKPFISFIGTHNKLPYLKDFCHEDAVFSLCLAMSNFTKKWMKTYMCILNCILRFHMELSQVFQNLHFNYIIKWFLAMIFYRIPKYIYFRQKIIIFMIHCCLFLSQ